METVPCWQPRPGDVFFLGGTDWRYLFKHGFSGLDNPRIGLMQGVHNLGDGTEQHHNLAERAIRVCVSPQVADTVVGTKRANGPILTIPNGTDVAPLEPSVTGSVVGFESRRLQAAIIGYKDPDLARNLSEALDAEGIEHVLATDFQDRDTFVGLLRESRIAVCLPRTQEGFYLVALEAMASGCTVVTMDCIGNRTFCRHADNCLMAERGIESLLETTKRALEMGASERGRLHRRALGTAVLHSMEAERLRFHEILRDIDRLWA